MNGVEIKEFLNKVRIVYPKFNLEDDTARLWSSVLCQYNAKEVNEMFEFYASREQFRETVPQVYLIVKSLTKIADKVDFTKKTVFCGICRRAFNDIAKCHEHENRCSAIRYIIKQYQRFELGEINNSKKRELYQMSQDAFDEKYNKLLKIVFKRTNREHEKEIIKNIFKSMGKEEEL